MIAASALEIATKGKKANVVADDTNVLMLLMQQWREGMGDVYFLSEPGNHRKKVSGLVVSKAGTIVLAHILFIHACTGCETTSATFGQEKKQPC